MRNENTYPPTAAIGTTAIAEYLRSLLFRAVVNNQLSLVRNLWENGAYVNEKVFV
jgi:hypothetical protein